MPAESKIITYKLPDGLRVVHLQLDSRVEYCGVAVRAGSRDELPEEFGLAHFVEHTIFKGTQNRSASRIINHMEAVGGELNAYTTKEETYVYSVFPQGNFRRAVDLISDLVINSRFPDPELDKEREVVAEEIDSYLDSPSDAVFDDFDDLIFAGTGLGHNILGSETALRTFDSASCRRFIDRFYSAPNMVFFYLGNLGESVVRRMIQSRFEALPSHPVSHDYSPMPAPAPFAVRRDDQDNHQAHTVVGALIPSLYSRERFAVALLNNILGGPGMNSMLNVALRERRGLVYSVDSSTSLYSDVGLLSIYCGCNPEDNNRCLRLIRNQLEQIAQKPMTQSALDRARRQFIGQQIVASASLEQTILSAARSMLFHNKVYTRAETTAILQSLTPDTLTAAARHFHPSRFSTLTLG